MRYLMLIISTIIVLFSPVAGHASLTAYSALGFESLWSDYSDQLPSQTAAMVFPYQKHFNAAATKYKLPVTFLLAVARGESDFNSRAISDANCHGIMQIQWPGTAKHLGVYSKANLYDPQTNILAGARYLRELVDRYDGNYAMALAAYNYGPTRIRKEYSFTQIPQGAKNYSGYIYHHLVNTIISESGMVTAQLPEYIIKEKLPFLEFDEYFRVHAVLDYFRKNDPKLRLDWFHSRYGRYEIVLLFSDPKELQQGIQSLKELGYSVDVKSITR